MIYLAQRLLHGAFVLLGVTAVVFGLTFLTGDPVSVLVPLNTSQAEMDRFRHEMGLDRPPPIQYLDFLSHAVRGDFGDSFRHHSPAMPLVLERLPATLRLSAVALAFALLISIPPATLQPCTTTAASTPSAAWPRSSDSQSRVSGWPSC